MTDDDDNIAPGEAQAKIDELDALLRAAVRKCLDDHLISPLVALMKEKGMFASGGQITPSKQPLVGEVMHDCVLQPPSAEELAESARNAHAKIDALPPRVAEQQGDDDD